MKKITQAVGWLVFDDKNVVIGQIYRGSMVGKQGYRYFAWLGNKRDPFFFMGQYGSQRAAAHAIRTQREKGPVDGVGGESDLLY